jgi:hypothetical protein
MASVKISELPEMIGDFDIDDLIETVDVSDTAISATGTSKKATLDQLTQFVNSRLKKSVRVASEVAVTKNSLIVSGGVIQSLTLEPNNRVLLGNQLDPGENGVWVVQASGPPTRPVDFHEDLPVSMALVPVEEGQWAGYVWICTAVSGFDIVGTDALPFQLVNSKAPPFDDTLNLVFSHGRSTTTLRVSLASLTTGTVRVLSMPDRDVDLGALAIANTTGQFSASHITNNSIAQGATVKDALDNLSVSVADGGSGSGRDGLKLSKISSSIIGISPGTLSLTSGDILLLDSPLAKSLNSLWSAGNSGGMDTGFVDVNTWYYVWLILNPTTDVTDALISMEETAPHMPSGYSVGVRLGAFKTNGSSNIIGFQQWHDWMFWDTPVDTTYTSAGSTAVLKTLEVPPAGIVEARVQVIVGGDINGMALLSAPDAVDLAPAAGQLTVRSGSSDQVNLRTDDSGQIRVRANSAGVVIHLWALGWRDGPQVWFD